MRFFGRLAAGAAVLVCFATSTCVAQIARELDPRATSIRGTVEKSVLLGSTSLKHDAKALAVKWSADGKRILSSSETGDVRIWDWPGGHEIAALEAGRAPAVAVDWSRDGRSIASIDGAGTMRVAREGLGPRTRRLRGKGTAVAVSPDGRWIAAGTDTGREAEDLFLWDVETGGRGRPFDCESPRQIAWSPDGERIWVLGDKKDMRGFDARSGRVVRSFEKVGDAFALSADGKRIAACETVYDIDAGGIFSRITLLDLDSGERRTLSPFEWDDRAERIALGPDGRHVATIVKQTNMNTLDTEGWIAIQDWETPETVRILAREKRSLHDLAFSPDGRWIAAAASTGAIEIWDIESGEKRESGAGHQGKVHALAAGPGDAWIASGGEDGTIRIWETATGSELARFAADLPVWGLAADPESGRIFAALARFTLEGLGDDDSGDGGHLVLAGPGGALVRQRSQIRPVGSILALAGGERLVTGELASTRDIEVDLDVFDAATGEWRTLLSAHSGGVWRIVPSPDGAWFLTAGEEGTIVLWRTADLSRVRSYEGHERGVRDVAPCPDGNWFVSASDDGTLRIWDIETAQATHVLVAHDRPVVGVGTSPDGKWIYSLGADRMLGVWDRATGRLDDAIWLEAAGRSLVVAGGRVWAGLENGKIVGFVHRRDRLVGLVVGDGARIERVLPWSAASAAGLLPGQKIVRVGSSEVAAVRDYEEAIALAREGDSLELEVEGPEGRLPPFTLVLGYEPQRLTRIGVSFLRNPEAEGGIRITDVTGEPAELAGIRAGDVVVSIGGVAIESAEAITEALWRAGPGVKVPFIVRRDGQELSLEVIPAELVPE